MTIHLAAEPEGYIQLCTLCGVCLIDYTGTMVLSSSLGPRFFEQGASVECGQNSTAVTQMPPNCSGTNKLTEEERRPLKKEQEH